MFGELAARVRPELADAVRFAGTPRDPRRDRPRRPRLRARSPSLRRGRRLVPVRRAAALRGRALPDRRRQGPLRDDRRCPTPPPDDGRFALSTRRGKQFNSMVQERERRDHRRRPRVGPDRRRRRRAARARRGQPGAAAQRPRRARGGAPDRADRARQPPGPLARGQRPDRRPSARPSPGSPTTTRGSASRRSDRHQRGGTLSSRPISSSSSWVLTLRRKRGRIAERRQRLARDPLGAGLGHQRPCELAGRDRLVQQRQHPRLVAAEQRLEPGRALDDGRPRRRGRAPAAAARGRAACRRERRRAARRCSSSAAITPFSGWRSGCRSISTSASPTSEPSGVPLLATTSGSRWALRPRVQHPPGERPPGELAQVLVAADALAGASDQDRAAARGLPGSHGPSLAGMIGGRWPS